MIATGGVDVNSMKMNCFKAYDIRGRIPDELNEGVAYRIGRAYAEFLRITSYNVCYTKLLRIVLGDRQVENTGHFLTGGVVRANSSHNDLCQGGQHSNEGT